MGAQKERVWEEQLDGRTFDVEKVGGAVPELRRLHLPLSHLYFAKQMPTTEVSFKSYSML
jgi:hypothetical protein